MKDKKIVFYLLCFFNSLVLADKTAENTSQVCEKIPFNENAVQDYFLGRRIKKLFEVVEIINKNSKKVENCLDAKINGMDTVDEFSIEILNSKKLAYSDLYEKDSWPLRYKPFETKATVQAGLNKGGSKIDFGNQYSAKLYLSDYRNENGNLLIRKLMSENKYLESPHEKVKYFQCPYGSENKDRPVAGLALKEGINLLQHKTKCENLLKILESGKILSGKELDKANFHEGSKFEEVFLELSQKRQMYPEKRLGNLKCIMYFSVDILDDLNFHITPFWNYGVKADDSAAQNETEKLKKLFQKLKGNFVDGTKQNELVIPKELDLKYLLVFGFPENNSEIMASLKNILANEKYKNCQEYIPSGVE